MKHPAPPPFPSEERRVSLRLIQDGQHYTEVVSTLASARVSLWIASANLKDLRVEAPIGSAARARGRYVSVLGTLSDLVKRGVEVRLLHATNPSRAFSQELGKHPSLRKTPAWLRQCPRVHLKIIAVDGCRLYMGSANFTGAGLGAKGEKRRNFEMGILTDDDFLLDEAQARFDAIWSGNECSGCRVRQNCPRPIDKL